MDDIKQNDTLEHQDGTIYRVRKSERGPLGKVLYFLENKTNGEVTKWSLDSIGQYFTKKYSPEEKTDLKYSPKSRPSAQSWEKLKLIRQEYQEYLAQYLPGLPPNHDKPYTNKELDDIIRIATEDLELQYQLAMEMGRTLTGIRYVIDKARDWEHPEHWKSWTEKGVPGDKSYWQVQTVLMGVPGWDHNPMLDNRPDLQVHAGSSPSGLYKISFELEFTENTTPEQYCRTLQESLGNVSSVSFSKQRDLLPKVQVGETVRLKADLEVIDTVHYDNQFFCGRPTESSVELGSYKVTLSRGTTAVVNAAAPNGYIDLIDLSTTGQITAYDGIRGRQINNPVVVNTVTVNLRAVEKI